jgi:hypothetical protein
MADEPMTTWAADGPFTCPRCAATVTERFYGPCTPCRAELIASQHTDEREITAERFEPRLHVTPNAVATKD